MYYSPRRQNRTLGFGPSLHSFVCLHHHTSIWPTSRLKGDEPHFSIRHWTHSYFTALSSCSSSHRYLLPSQNNREDRGREAVGESATVHGDTIADQLWWMQEKAVVLEWLPLLLLYSLSFTHRKKKCDCRWRLVEANHCDKFIYLSLHLSNTANWLTVHMYL